jgi:hypothetical protein
VLWASGIEHHMWTTVQLSRRITTVGHMDTVMAKRPGDRRETISAEWRLLGLIMPPERDPHPVGDLTRGNMGGD